MNSKQVHLFIPGPGGFADIGGCSSRRHRLVSNRNIPSPTLGLGKRQLRHIE